MFLERAVSSCIRHDVVSCLILNPKNTKYVNKIIYKYTKICELFYIIQKAIMILYKILSWILLSEFHLS